MQISRALISGSSASIVSTLALGLCGVHEEGAAAGPINGPSQWLWGQAEAQTRELTWRHTAVGYAIHHAMSLLWANVFEQMQLRSASRLADLRAMDACTNAALVAMLAYVVDYGVAPPRLRPGFKKHLGARSIFLVYAAFGAGLALGSLLNAAVHVGRQPRRARAHQDTY